MENGRREIKFLIPLLEYKKLEAKLMLTMHPDMLGGTSGLYRVRSLYFDSLRDDDYFDVLRGGEIRKKIRLRVYPPKGKSIRLEHKFKQGVNQLKTAIPITRAQALEMMGGRYGFISKLAHPHAMTIYRELTTGAYQPKMLVEYQRQAYTAPGNSIRITFDTDIRASWRCEKLFSKKINFTPLIAADQGVLEVKYNRFLYSYIKDLLGKMDELPVAMSKYVLGRAAML